MNATLHIENHLSEAPEGTNISANEFLHLSNRAALDVALSRLAKANELLRIERGTYVAPVQTRFGTRPPSVEAVVRDWGRRHFVAVEPAGAASANALGLTTQVPLSHMWLTTGRSTTLRIGKATVTLKNAPAWRVLPGRAGQVLRALEWMGASEAKLAWPRVSASLQPAEHSTLLNARSVVPTWLAELLSELEA